MRRILIMVFGLLIAATPASAQDDRPIGVNVGFGWAFPVGKLNDAFDTGWNGAIGVTANITPTFGVQAEYMYARMGGPERTISIVDNPAAAVATNGLLESNHHMHVGTFNLVARTNRSDSMVQGYGIGGLGIYNRTVEITSPSVGYTTYCDPYWYVCYPTLVSVDRVVGDRSSNDFGINVGGGITFGTDAKFFVELRYHYVWGPEIEEMVSTLPSSTDGTGTGKKYSTNGQYIPLTFGVRW